MEEKSGQFDLRDSWNQFKEASTEIFSSPTGRLILMASTVRSVGNNCIGYYKPIYFENVYPDKVDEFAIGNALMFVFISSVGALLGGYLSDKFEDE